MKSLLITLGHNASAIYYDSASIGGPLGYEEERLNGVKSSSSFPKLAIERILKLRNIEGATIFISHWFDNFNLSLAREKYYDRYFIDYLVKEYGCTVVALSKEFTHHDAHAWSAFAFIEDQAKLGVLPEDLHHLVVDGFGNQGEVLSIYRHAGGEPRLLHRGYGYGNSLGLMYQYATSFCGMKENQDEYKFLGYENKIDQVLKPKQLDKLGSMVRVLSYQISDAILNSTLPKEIAQTHIDLHALGQAKTNWYNTFYNLLVYLDCPKDDHTKRIVIGYFIQSIIEESLARVLLHFNVSSVTLSGGCFYNVKLNNTIASILTGKVSVMPLAGDQGAAIGMYRKYVGKFEFGDLCYGTRDYFISESTDDVLVTSNQERFIDYVTTMLRNNQIVNIIRGKMEFGPRALCNTTTLALPTKENVDYINMINERSTVMPMAPVMTQVAADMLFEDINALRRIIGSNKFMIITHNVSKKTSEDPKLSGIMHKYPMREEYSARPQIIPEGNDFVLEAILQEMHCETLINTSFNTHGTPILFNEKQIIEDFKKQKEKDTQGRVKLAILKHTPKNENANNS